MSHHRSSEHSTSSQPTSHKSYRRPTRRRSKVAVVGVVALGLTGAASFAHANFGDGTWHKPGKSAVAAQNDVKTMADVELRRWPHPDWPTSWPRPTSTPTTSGPTSVPSGTPTTTRPPTGSPTTSTPTTSTPTTSAPSGSVAWPGHVPGKFILGMSCASSCDSRGRAVGGSYGVHRSYEQWGNWNGLAKDIQADQKIGMMPWISIKPPANGAAGWQRVSSGAVDSEIKALATTLKANDDQPVLITFHHEPSNDGTEAQGAQWAAAYARFHDVLKAEGALRNVADPPILGDWLFNPTNKQQDPANWATSAVLSRAPFMGIDLYQNKTNKTMADRIPIVLDYLKSKGYPKMMVGIGETGATDRFSGTTAAKWINDSLSWVAANTDKVGVISYFNSSENSKSHVYWPLDESASKTQAFKSWLSNSKVIDGM